MTTSDRAALTQMARDEHYRGSLQHLRSWSDIDWLLTSLADASDTDAATIARLTAALAWIAEEHDAGRHDGLPEPCPAHEADTMFAVARAALSGDLLPDPRDAEIKRLREENVALLSGRSFNKHMACYAREDALAEEIERLREERAQLGMERDLAQTLAGVLQADNARLTADLAQARAKALEEAGAIARKHIDFGAVERSVPIDQSEGWVECAWAIDRQIALASASPDATAQGEGE